MTREEIMDVLDWQIERGQEVVEMLHSLGLTGLAGDVADVVAHWERCLEDLAQSDEE